MNTDRRVIAIVLSLVTLAGLAAHFMDFKMDYTFYLMLFAVAVVGILIYLLVGIVKDFRSIFKKEKRRDDTAQSSYNRRERTDSSR